MKRSDLSVEGRETLTKLVADLFDGYGIEVKQPDGESRFMCFRMRDDELPHAPVMNRGKLYGAMENSIFLSADVFEGKKRVDRKWLSTGPLDEILLTLQNLGDVHQFLDQYKMQRTFQAAFSKPGSVGNAGFVCVDLSAPVVPKATEIAPANPDSYAEWEGLVCERMENDLEITTSDAQGMMMAQHFALAQEWDKGSNVIVAAKRVADESSASASKLSRSEHYRF